MCVKKKKVRKRQKIRIVSSKGVFPEMLSTHGMRNERSLRTT